MTRPEISPSALVAQVVADVCLPVVAGAKPGQAPAEAIALSEAERREQCGLTDPGRTAVYQLAEGDVFLDLAANRSMLWFGGRDARSGLAALEAALKRTGHDVKQTHDDERQTPGMRTRIYMFNVSPERVAQVEVAYMQPGPEATDEDRFKVAVYAFSTLDAEQRGALLAKQVATKSNGRSAPGAAAGVSPRPAPDPKKKKKGSLF